MSDLVLLVGKTDGGDCLLDALAITLRDKGAEPVVVPARRLAGLPITACDSVAETGGNRIAAVVFRARRDDEFGDGFMADDRSFASSEALSVWLHVLSLPTVKAINRADAETWFSSAPWWRWRTRLVDGGVDVAPVGVGDLAPCDGTWLLWGGGERPAPSSDLVRRVFATAIAPGLPTVWSTLCCGEVVEGPAGSEVLHAAQVMRRHGIELVAIGSDTAGRIVSIDTCPYIGARAAPRTAQLLAQEIMS